jgi:hypothetical protein
MTFCGMLGVREAKGHLVAAHFWDNFHLWLGIPTVVLAGVAGTAAFAKFDQDNIIAFASKVVLVVAVNKFCRA